MSTGRPALLLALILLVAASASPQQPVFRAGVAYVEVDAYVTDRQGHFLRGLRKEDFTILEDGKPQPVTSLELIDLSRTGAAPPPSVAEASATLVPSQGGNPSGAVYFVVLDDLHTTAERTPLARKLAADFLKQVPGPNDVAAVFFTSSRPSGAQDLTQNRETLVASVDRAMGAKLPSPALSVIPGSTATSVSGGARISQAKRAFAALNRVVAYASIIHGRRKAMILISEGLDIDINPGANPDADPQAGDIASLVREFMASANRANLSVYAIDHRGIAGRLSDMTENVSAVVLQNEERLSQEGLRVIAVGTGGAAFVNTSNFGRVFDSIRDDNSTYYLLAYAAPGNASDGKYHQIEVRLNRPDATVRARHGYTAGKGQTRD